MEVSQQELITATGFRPDCPIVVDDVDGVGVSDSCKLPVNMTGVVNELALPMGVAENDVLLITFESRCPFTGGSDVFLGLRWASRKLQISNIVSLSSVAVYGMKRREDATEVDEFGHEYVGPDWVRDLGAVRLADKSLLCG